MATIQDANIYGDYYYIDSDKSSERLTQSQMNVNASNIWLQIQTEFPSWTINAVSAILGNIQSEGIMNPSQWEYGHNKSLSYGYGLVQWTPATKILNWLDENSYSRTDTIPQIRRLEYERSTGIQYYKTNSYPISFTTFLTDTTLGVDYLATAWLYNYERPRYPEQSKSVRISRSNAWKEYLSGITPTPPYIPDVPSGLTHLTAGMKIYMYPKRKEI